MNDPILLAAALARRFEGLCLRPYVCAAGYWTIGYGSRWLANGAAMCAHAAPITAAEAESLLLAALRTLQPEIRKIVHVSLTARQEAALLDFAFNLGLSALAGSTLLRRLNAGQGAVARNQFLLWNHMHKAGQLITSPGLTRQQHAEWLVWAGQPFV
ncbi:lysozyme [Acetobacter tropicalis]|uniref:lysozyme n=1 Tax=Acetobacter TaxID=434 RepID=UPI001EDBF902|nr:lysozyme [Acetobacter senegalensis]MCG4253163.1 lysozyme [Acetobacter senegalensis]